MEQSADDLPLVIDVPSVRAGGGTSAAGPRAINFVFNKNYSTTSNAAARPCDGDSAEQPAVDPLVVVDAPSLSLPVNDTPVVIDGGCGKYAAGPAQAIFL